MFDFENLEVYRKAKAFYKDIELFLKSNKRIDAYLRDQLRRASTSVVINIAEGSGRFSKADKRNFYTIARGSVYEIASILDLIGEGESNTNSSALNEFHSQLETISKMLLGLIKSQSTP